VSFPFPHYAIDAVDPFERGLQHGRAARERVGASVATYRRMFQDFVGVDWDRAKAMGEAYGSAVAQFDEALLEEIRGIAAGSGFDTSEILALNARSEIALGPGIIDGCTAVAAFGAATKDGSTLLCQNWDWRASQRDAFVALTISRPGRPRFTMLTEAGIIGKIGFNERGLGVCLNAIVTDEVRSDGTPLHVVLRGILESRSLGDAVETVSRGRIASAANFLIAQAGAGALDIEATPSRIDVLLPDRDALVHTNHLQSARLASVNDLGVNVLPDSYPRLATARRFVEQHHGRLDHAAMQDILRNHVNEPDSICRHEDKARDPEGTRLQSVFSVVMNLDRQSLWATDGPPCAADYVEFEHAGSAVGAGAR
jgi:isopenicillin-N N-acyltransferase-like protein